MDSPPFDKSQVKLLSAHQVDPEALATYYREVYPQKHHVLIPNWQWKYRTSFFDQRIPIVLSWQEQVIAQAAMIPVNVLVGEQRYTASWFIDFTVSDRFQRKGLGTILTKKWMTFADLQITFCNERSIGVFRKLGWSESTDTYLHLFALSPFKLPNIPQVIPGWIKKSLDGLVRPLVRWHYRRQADQGQATPLDSNNLQEFLTCYQKAQDATPPSKRVTVLRDPAFAKWRLLESPDRANYLHFKTDDNEAILARKTHKGNFLDILWIADTQDPERVARLISSIALFGMQQGISYMRAYTSSATLTQHLKRRLRSIVRNPLFAYFSDHPELKDQINQFRWDWQLIDSDFERFA